MPPGEAATDGATAGSRFPTVVYEAGAAADRSTWALVQGLTGRRVRSVVYDRAGLGRSPESDGPRTLEAMAADLGHVLDALGPGPFVLVGHSLGGPVVRAAAALEPGRISGIVLVDPTDENAAEIFSPAFRRAERLGTAVGQVLARTGLLRLSFSRYLALLPEDAAEDIRREAFGPRTVRTQKRQARTFLDELATWRGRRPWHPEGIPATVVSGGRPGDGLTRRFRASANGAHLRSALSVRGPGGKPAGRQVIVPGAGHYVPITHPETVAAEILRTTLGA